MPLLEVIISRHKKWDRQGAEKRLKRAVLAAMRDGSTRAVSPSAVAKHAGLSKSLIYLHFGSVDALVSQAVRERTNFPPIAGFASLPSFRKNSLHRAMAVCEELSGRLEPELLDLLAWSLGNATPIAFGVMEALRDYCNLLATEVVGEEAFAPMFMGKFLELASARQRVMYDDASTETKPPVVDCP